jgi:NADH:ubiquinone reductase (H+-translocating)
LSIHSLQKEESENAMHTVRRILLGMVIGLIVAGSMLAAVGTLPGVSGNGIIVMDLGGSAGLLAAGILTGGGYAWLFRPKPGDQAAHLMNGLVVGLVTWVVLSVNALPALMGESPMWEVRSVRHFLPALVAYLFQGGFIGLIYGLVYPRVAEPWNLTGPEPSHTAPAITTRVVIVGGGYAGVNAAQTLERELEDNPHVGIWLVSDTNYLLHTPMLSEVSASAVNAQHISPVLRNFFRRVQVVQGCVDRVDLEKRTIHWGSNTPPSQQALSFDHLVLTTGSVPDFFGDAGIEAQAFTFKSLRDAVLLRNQVIDAFERADFEQDEQKRRRLLTFVVAGGGFAGVELIGALNDFARGMLPYYPNISPDELQLILVHAHETILEELSESLGKYAQKKLEQRGVQFILGARVTGTETGRVFLGERVLEAETFIWTAGNKPSPLLDTLGLPLTKRGQIETDAKFAVPGVTGLWAAGDCAHIPDLSAGGFCPPTAQHALREGQALGHNVAASIKGTPLKPFRYKTLGSLAALGYQVAVAEILGFRFSGFLAWLTWRGIYLVKLPTLDRQVRVGLDWLLDIFFPPAMVQTIGFTRTMASGEMEGPDSPS